MVLSPGGKLRCLQGPADDMNEESRQADHGGSGQSDKCMSHPKGAATAQHQLSGTRKKGKPRIVSSFQIFTGRWKSRFLVEISF